MEIKRFAVGKLWTNCYVISDGTVAAVVDPGGETSDVEQWIDEHGLAVKWILLTHGHGDHIFGLEGIRGRAEHGTAIGAGDADKITNASFNLSVMLGEPTACREAERLLDDGDVLEVGALTLRVITTPGHTPGGVCYIVEENGVPSALISGDTLFARTVGRTDLEGGDQDELASSLKKLRDLPDELDVYPGHGPVTTIGFERRLNPFWPR